MIAVDVLDAVKTHCLDEVFEFSGRGSYKILVSSFSQFPDSVIGDLKSLRKTSSTFGGIRGTEGIIDSTHSLIEHLHLLRGVCILVLAQLIHLSCTLYTCANMYSGGLINVELKTNF